MKLHRIGTVIATGVVAAVVAAPVGLAGTFVAPAQVSEAQLKTGHGPATRLVQIGGALVAPSDVSAYENAAGGATSTGSSGDSSSGLGTSGIAGAVVLGSLLLAGASALVLRHRRKLVTA